MRQASHCQSALEILHFEAVDMAMRSCALLHDRSLGISALRALGERHGFKCPWRGEPSAARHARLRRGIAANLRPPSA